MPAPPVYDRDYSFTDWETTHPGEPKPGVSLDTEFDDVSLALTATQDALALIQRTDGALANDSVGPDQLIDGLFDAVADGITDEAQVAADAAAASAAAAATSATAAAGSASAAATSASTAAGNAATAGVSQSIAQDAANEAAASAGEADVSASEAELAANETAGNVAETEAAVELAFRWAEYLTGPVLPAPPGWPEAVDDGMFSSKWWALRARDYNAVSDIDLGSGQDDIGDAFLEWDAIPGNDLPLGLVYATWGDPPQVYVLTDPSHPEDPDSWMSITGPEGPQGDVGPIGPAGPANSLAIGTVTTGAPGSSAAASITGTPPTQTLNLTIPEGDTGAAGAAGPPNSLAIGTVTTLAPGSSATATITGTPPSQTLNLGIPQGVAGSGGSGAGADPTATIGLTAVNGVATTLLRSDGAPALSQAISPTWTGNHVFQTTIRVAPPAAAAALRLTPVSTSQAQILFDATTAFVIQDMVASTTRMSIDGTTGVTTFNGEVISGTRFRVGSAPLSSPGLSAISITGGNSLEWGHSNTGGYRSTLGNNTADGKPFLAFSAEAGTTANTFRTRGIIGNIIRSNIAGALEFGRAATATADNQSLTVDMTISATGVVNFASTPTVAGSPLSVAPAGADTQVQYNDGGAFGAEAGFTWAKATNVLTVGSSSTAGTVKGADGGSGGSVWTSLFLEGGDGLSGQRGGHIQVIAGTSAAGENGGNTYIKGGPSTGAIGGQVWIEGATSTAGGGGGINVNAANATTSGVGGDVAINAGDSATSASAGGGITVTAGNGGATGVGGATSISAGRGGATSGAGGLLTLQGGSALSGAGGAVAVTGRNAATSGAGGAVTITSGNGIGTNQNAGTITIQTGTRTGTGTANIILQTNGTRRLSIDVSGAWAVGSAGTETGTAGQALVSNGTGTPPTWQTILTGSSAPNWTGGPHTFTLPLVYTDNTPLVFQSGHPGFYLYESDQAAGERRWVVAANAKVLRIAALADATSTGVDAISIARGTAQAITSITLAGIVDVTGGDLRLSARGAMLDLADGYLRLNNSTSYVNGVFTPAALRAGTYLRADLALTDGASARALTWNVGALTYGTAYVSGAVGSYHGIGVLDGTLNPTLMSSGSAAGVYNQGEAKWLIYRSAATVAQSAYNLEAPSFNATSSRAIKRETGKPSRAADILARLRPILYRLLADDTREQLGLIAEEVHEVCPQLSDGKTVSYDRLALLLLADWQESRGLAVA